MTDLKKLSDEELLLRKSMAVGAEERARVRYNKTRSPKDGQRYQRARELAGALRNEMRIRNYNLLNDLL